MVSEGSPPAQEPARSDGSTVPTTVDAAESTFSICGVSTDFKHAVHFRSETMLEAYRIFEERRLDDPDADFVVECGGIRLNAHKELLAERLPYFDSLFARGFKEHSTGSISLSSHLCPFEPEDIRAIIDYSYHGECTITEDNASSLLAAATFLQMETIIDACANFLLKRVRCDSALSLLAQFRAAGFHQLDDRLWRFIDANFIPISRTPAFAELPVEDLITIVQRNSLRIDSEEQVLEAIRCWIEVDSARWEDAARLLARVRLASLPASTIELIRSQDWVKDNPDCLRILSQHTNMPRDDRFSDDAIAIICILTEERGARAGRIGIYNPVSTELNVVTTSWLPPRYLHAAVIGPMVYCLGGSLDSGRALDIRTNTWSTLPAMPSVRDTAAVNVIDGVIYVAGGYGGDYHYPNATASLIALDTRQQHPEWVELAPMTFPRYFPGSCVLNGRLYVFGGGTDAVGDESHAHCEVYEPKTNQWTPIAPLWSPTRPEAVAFKSRIYVADGDGRFEEYDPATDTWTRRAKKPYNSYDGLFVSGGRILDMSTLTVCDVARDEWKILDPLLFGNGMEDCMFALPVPASVPLPLATLESQWTKFYEDDEV